MPLASGARNLQAASMPARALTRAGLEKQKAVQAHRSVPEKPFVFSNKKFEGVVGVQGEAGKIFKFFPPPPAKSLTLSSHQFFQYIEQVFAQAAAEHGGAEEGGALVDEEFAREH